jgi:hypothetical protein
MKNKILIILVAALIAASVNAQMTINSAGLIGMRTAPVTGNSLTVNIDQKVYFYSPLRGNGIIVDNTGGNYGGAIYPSANNIGNVGCSNKAFKYVYSYGGSISLSDKRQKENIKNINNALSIVLKLQGVRYDLKKEFSFDESLIKNSKIKEKLEKERKDKIGFIAQDVYKVLPEVVVYDDSTDIYGIVYDKIVPILVEAIKEQQTLIDELTEKVNKNSSTVKSQKDAVNIENSSNVVSYLAQNTPNPFNQSTVIEYYLSENTQNAMLNIYDMNGLQLKSVQVTSIGKGSVTIQSLEFKPGMYMYNLIADGKVIDTKRMILTQ